jgi:hypothetical protein
MEFDSLVYELLEKHELVMARGINRKHLNQIPDSALVKPFKKNYMPRSKTTLATVKNAKENDKVLRRVTPAEAQDMSAKYGFQLPHQGNSVKHLGSTGIKLTYQGPNKYIIAKR